MERLLCPGLVCASHQRNNSNPSQAFPMPFDIIPITDTMPRVHRDANVTAIPDRMPLCGGRLGCAVWAGPTSPSTVRRCHSSVASPTRHPAVTVESMATSPKPKEAACQFRRCKPSTCDLFEAKKVLQISAEWGTVTAGLSVFVGTSTTRSGWAIFNLIVGSPA